MEYGGQRYANEVYENVDHYDTIPSAVEQRESPQRFVINTKLFIRDFGVWGYVLLISLLPSFMVFLLFKGPPNNFAFLELFHDNALFYVCVTMSAVSLFTYGKINWVAAMHSLVMLFGMAMYIITLSGVPIDLFDKCDRRELIAWFLLLSVLLGIMTMLYSATQKGEAK